MATTRFGFRKRAKMSDIDRRRYIYKRGMDVFYPARENEMIDPPSGNYYHESAVRELVEALRLVEVDMSPFETEDDDDIGNVVLANVRDLLAHYKDF